MNKIYLDANHLLQDAFRLGFNIIESGYRPDFLVAIWRGGTPVAIAIQELLAYCGIPNEHLTIRTRHYGNIGQRLPSVRVDGLDLVLREITGSSRLLIVDDVFDTGLSVHRVLTDIESVFSGNPPEIRTATLYYKPAYNRTGREPDYFLHTTSDWLVFPHELVGLSAAEIRDNKPWLGLLKDEFPPPSS